jgi:hypothetical protein
LIGLCLAGQRGRSANLGHPHRGVPWAPGRRSHTGAFGGTGRTRNERFEGCRQAAHVGRGAHDDRVSAIEDAPLARSGASSAVTSLTLAPLMCHGRRLQLPSDEHSPLGARRRGPAPRWLRPAAPLLPIFDRTQKRRDSLIIGLSFGGQAQREGGPLDELRSEPALECGDTLRDRRLT